MSRDSSGNYTLPLPPVAPNTLIESTWANTTNDDIAIAMTDSLSRSGLGGMLAPLKIADGVALNPSFTFTNEVNSGIYRAGSNDVRWSLGGLDIVRMYDDGLGSRSITVENDLSVNGAATLALLTVSGLSDLQGNATVGGTLGVTGLTTLATLLVSGLADLQGDAQINGTLSVTGVATLGTVNMATLSVSGALDVTGILTAESGSLAVGQDDSQAGTAFLYGDGPGSNSGGAVFLHTAADHDASVEYFIAQALDSRFAIGTNVNGTSGVVWDGVNWNFGPNSMTLGGNISTLGNVVAAGQVLGAVTGVGIAAGAGRFEVVNALPGTPDPNTVYFVL